LPVAEVSFGLEVGAPTKPPEEVKTYVVYFWKNENVFQPPAERTKNITWTGELRKARIHVILHCGWDLDKVTLNEQVLGENLSGNEFATEIDPSLVNYGLNTLRLDYTVPWGLSFLGCACTAYLELWCTGKVEVEGVEAEKPWWEKLIDYIPLMVIGFIVISAMRYIPPPRRRERE
jgi:hypothetical protein